MKLSFQGGGLINKNDQDEVREAVVDDYGKICKQLPLWIFLVLDFLQQF